MSLDLQRSDAVAIATAIRAGSLSALTVISATLSRITARNRALNCFTAITADSAWEEASKIALALAQGDRLGSLAGVPFAVKNLFDVAGLTTLAGSKINADNPPARRDATAVTRLKQAGAVLVGTLNMDEYACGFTTENSHYGVTLNPHDQTRLAGGSSGGSAAAVAAGLVPLTLGSDTNGSIRIPAALCGVYGFKPTYGRLSRAGTVLFASSLDHIGPLARSVRDIATVFDLLQGEEPQEPVCTKRPPQPCLPELNRGLAGLRIAIADDYFTQGAEPEALEAVELVAKALGVQERVTLPESARTRVAAIITAAEGASEHLKNLRSRPGDFDPATRDFFQAGALIPASWYIEAQRFRSWYRARLHEIFQTVDIILAPTTPCVAPTLGQEQMVIAGSEIRVREYLGRFTRPFSFIGLPVLSVPLQQKDALPAGVQIVAAPYNESLILRVAAVLESIGIVSAPIVE